VRDGARGFAKKGADTLRHVPGVEQFQQAMLAALDGLLRSLMDVGTVSVSRSTAARRLKRKGHDVTEFKHIRGLSLEVCDSAFPRRKRFAYMGGSAVQGAVAAVVATVGDVEALIGAPFGGVGGAPGAAQVIAAMAGDMAGLLVGASRLAAETGAAYGYDPDEPKEKIFVAGVLGLATAGTESAKWAAYQELSQLTQMLARKATWERLNANQIASILAKVYKALGFRLYKQTLSDAVPVAGILLGAGMNAGLMSRVADEAYYTYRERRLREDFSAESLDDGGVHAHAEPGQAGAGASPSVTDTISTATAEIPYLRSQSDASKEDVISIVEIIESEIAEESGS
jgi:hypothetical protein